MEELTSHCREIRSLPSTGVPGDLKDALATERQAVDERLAADDFHTHVADLNTALTSMKSQVAIAVERLAEQQRLRIEGAVAGMATLDEWKELTQEQQSNVARDLEATRIDASPNLGGLRDLLFHESAINGAVAAARKTVITTGAAVRQKRHEEEISKVKDTSRGPRSVEIPAVVMNEGELDRIIADLQEIRSQMSLYTQLEIKIAQRD